MIFNAILFVAAAAALGAYVCRVDPLRWHLHRARFILAHIAGGAACTGVLYMAGTGRATALTVLPLAAAVAGLALTYRQWRNGPPPYTLRRSVARR